MNYDKDIDLSYLKKKRMTREEYIQAYQIYLDVAYPNRKEENEALTRNENRMFTVLPTEVRNGCPACPNMKMIVVTGKAWCNDHFKVYIPMDVDDLTRGKCEEVAERIEEAWKEAGLETKKGWIPREAI